MKIKGHIETDLYIAIELEDGTVVKYEKVRQRPNVVTPEAWKEYLASWESKKENGRQVLSYSAGARLQAFFVEYVDELKHQMKPLETSAGYSLNEDTVKRITNLVADYQKMLLEDNCN